MLGFGNTRPGRTAVTASVACDGDLDVCERFPASLCRQALLTIRYADVAGQVICDVSVSERMPGRSQRATETIRISLRRCRPATVAASRASGRNGTTAPPCSDCPAALRAAQAPPRSTAESSSRRSASRCVAASGRHQVRGEPAIPVPEWQLLWEVLRGLTASTDSSAWRCATHACHASRHGPAPRRQPAASSAGHSYGPHRAVPLRLRPRRGTAKAVFLVTPARRRPPARPRLGQRG
jgi:hypothetical protein